MTDSPERYGNYDPFEDTGDWPFRDAPPPEESQEREDPVRRRRPAAARTAPVEAEEPVAEQIAPEPEPEPEPEQPEPEPALPRAGARAARARAGESRAAAAAEVADEASSPEPEPEPEEEPDEVSEESADEETESAEEDELEPVAEAAEVEIAEEDELEPMAVPAAADHAAGALLIPDGVDVLTGAPHGFRRSVGIVVSRFNGEITTAMLEQALEALRDCHVADDAITVVPVPGAFELPLTALALAKTRRFACIVALGCIIRGETPHFDVIAGEAASGLQLAAIETGIPVSFGVLTCDTREQAEARVDRAADAARTALEMADLFSHVRTRAAQG